MSVNVMKLKGATADAIMEYLNVRDRYLAYTLDADPNAPIADDFEAWAPANVVGSGAAHLGFGRGLEIASGVVIDRGVTAGDYRQLVAGVNPNTGEQVVTSRSSPVYEMEEDARDEHGRLTGKPRYKLDAEGNKIRKMVAARDRDGHEIVDASGAPKLVPAMNKNQPTPVEIVYSATKSFSVALAAADDAGRAALLGAFDEAVRASITRIEDTALLVRVPVASNDRELAAVGGRGPKARANTRTQGSATRRTTGKLIALVTRQHTARPTIETEARGGAPDMHLHAHVQLAPFALSPETSTPNAPDYKMIDSWGLMQRDCAALNAAQFEMDLSSRAEALGFAVAYDEFNKAGNGLSEWRLDGISADAVKHFSTNTTRQAAFVEELREQDELKRTPARSVVQSRMHDTKLAKSPAVRDQDRDPDYELWREDAARNGIDLVDGLLRVDADEVRPPSPKDRPIAQRLDQWRERMVGSTRGLSEAGLHREQAKFSLIAARATTWRCAMGLFDPEEMPLVEDHLSSMIVALDSPLPGRAVATLTEVNDYLKGLDHDERVMVEQALETVSFTTPEHLDTEQRIATRLGAKLTRMYPAASVADVETAVAAQGTPLDDEQRALVAAAVSGRGVVTVEGHAGTGKTTAVRAAVDALRSSGAVDHVVVVSTAARTAEGVGQRLGADVAGSIESIAAKVDLGSLHCDASTLVVIDEVAMVDTARMDKLLAAVGNARIVQLGDDHQMVPIGAAGWLQDFTRTARDTAPDSVVTLQRVYRQIDSADVRALTQLREGNGEAALLSLASRGRLHIFDTAQEAQDALVAAYRTDLDAGLGLHETRVGTDQSNKDLDFQNLAIQNERLDRGEVGAEGFRVTATNAERSWMLRPGDPVVFLEAYGKGESRVANGVGGVINDVDPTRGVAVIHLDHDDRDVVVRLSAEAETQPVGLAYAMHGMKFQGGETRNFHVRPGAPERTDVNAGYSLLSRATHEAHVYLDRETHGEDPVANLGRAWDEAYIKTSAMSALEQRQPAPDSARNQDAPQQLIARRMARLERVIGPEQTDAVRNAAAFPALMKQMDTLSERGFDADVMLREAAHRDSLNDASDPAAVLHHRIETARPVQLEHSGLDQYPDHRDLITPEPRDRAQEWAAAKTRVRAARSSRNGIDQRGHEPDHGFDWGR